MENRFKVENYILDNLQLTDANQLFQLMFDNKEQFKLFFPQTLELNSSLEKTAVYIAVKNREIQEKTNFTFAIRDTVTQLIAGLIIVKKLDWVKRQGEFAYCIGAKFQRLGLGSFAVNKLSNVFFESMGLKTIQIITHKTNLGSVKVAVSNGFVWQKTLQNEFTPTNGVPLDMELYELYNEK